MTSRLKILFHDNCFDGAASAALFGRFYLEQIDPRAELVYAGKHHAPATGPIFTEADFDADVHAIVDFRYAADERLTWWFDHHASAFARPDDEAHFRGRTASRFFFDVNARSCTKLLADSLGRVYDWRPPQHRELIRWADLIDGAQFKDAAQATALAEPALQLMTFVEHNQDEALKRRLIEGLTRHGLDELAREAWVQAEVEPVRVRDARAETLIRAHLRTEAGVAVLDLGDAGLPGYNKFVPYAIAPEAHYVVAISTSADRLKVSVGQNPWNKPERPHHIARLCERYGGGGHAVVGAISLPAGALAEARRIAGEIAETLRRDPA